MNNFVTAHFSLFVIDAYKNIFKAIIFIHVSFIHKIEVFSQISIRPISNTPLILYFSHIFNFQHCLRNNITADIFLNKRMLLFDGLILA